jgi:aminoglycoside phosphotransferase family enzyme
VKADERTAARLPGSDDAEGCPLEAKIAHLRDPGSYSPPTSKVQVVETHMSWVFLTDLHAWKLKKPMRREFFDFSTLAARKSNCETEVRLNRRLAAHVYLAAVPLVRQAAGALALGACGRPVEWLVQMRRLPRQRMLDVALASAVVGEADIARVVNVLAAFYRSLAPDPTPAEAVCARLAKDVAASRVALADPAYRLPAAPLAAVADALLRFLDTHAALLRSRAAAGHIVEGHGDLRPEHICLIEPPVVIDCLEFNRNLRLLDVAEELAVLALECESLGAAGIGARLFAECCALLGDRVSEPLFHFYAGGRALLRARLAALHVADVPADRHGRWIDQAHRYLALGVSHAERLQGA